VNVRAILEETGEFTPTVRMSAHVISLQRGNY
jgi:hypothetical protein